MGNQGPAMLIPERGRQIWASVGPELKDEFRCARESIQQNRNSCGPLLFLFANAFDSHKPNRVERRRAGYSGSDRDSGNLLNNSQGFHFLSEIVHGNRQPAGIFSVR